MKIIFTMMALLLSLFLVGCGEEDVSQIDSNEFYGSDENQIYAIPESVGPTELPVVIGPSTPPPRE